MPDIEHQTELPAALLWALAGRPIPPATEFFEDLAKKLAAFGGWVGGPAEVRLAPGRFRGSNEFLDGRHRLGALMAAGRGAQMVPVLLRCARY